MVARKSSRPIFEALESRIVFSAALAPSVAAPSLNSAVALTVSAPPAPFVQPVSVAGLSAPTRLTASAGSLGVSLAWIDHSTRETGFTIFRSTNGAAFQQVAQIARNSTSFFDADASAGNTYTYYVQPFSSKGVGKASKSASVTLAPSNPPAAPSDLQLTVASDAIALNWVDNSTSESGLHIYRSTDAMNYSLVATLPAGATTWDDSSVDPATLYTYSVAAFNSAGEASVNSPVATSIVSAANFPMAPNAPQAAAASAITSSSLTLSWTEASANIGGFNIYRSTDGVSLSLVAAVSSATTSWTDNSLAAGTTYYYSISSWNAAGETIAPRLITTTGSSAPALPSAPLYLSPSNVTTSGATLAWFDSSTNETGFHVYRSMSGGAYSVVASLSANTSTWTDSGLAASTTYNYYVTAFNSAGETASFLNTITTAPLASNPVSIYTKNMTSFTELDVDGSALNDTINVAQTNGVLTITANGVNYIYNNTFGDIVIRGGAGNDTITVAAGVNIPALIYGGDGNDTLTDLTSAKATIVSIGNGNDTLTGNGINTAYWANPGDIVNASATEIALGGVNRVAGFYQPWSTDPNNANYISRELYGQSLADPTDSGVEIKLPNSSFFGTGASMHDVNQGYLSDCYFVGPLSALANTEPARLQDMGVDLGDGTYAVRFVRNGVATYVRVDGDLTTGPFNFGLGNTTPGSSGNLWASIFEKAYAFYRSGANTYASTNWGAPATALRDLGFTSSAFTLSATSALTALSTINSVLASGRAVTVATNGAIIAGVPLVESHIYTVVSAYLDISGNLMLQLYNPWGIDGFNVDSNPNDGLITLSYTTLVANASQCVYSTL